MQRIQEETKRLLEEAAVRTNQPTVSPDQAFIIDEVNLFQRLGKDTFIALSTEFYNRVYADVANPTFHQSFASRNKQEAIQNQYEFLIQRMGGPPLFSERKGHPALIGRHLEFNVSAENADRWLHHMRDALDAVPQIDPDSKTRMRNFFQHTAYFLVAGCNR